MNRNIEIKARVSDLEATLRSISEIAVHSEDIRQTDTFFHCPNGRMKLRQVAGHESGELISYLREDLRQPKASTYVRCPVPDVAQMTEVLSLSLGPARHVSKRRQVFMTANGKARIHLDEVQDLVGRFLEIEVLLADEDSIAFGQAIMTRLMAQLGVEANDLVAHAYVDQIETERHSRFASYTRSTGQ